MFVFVGKAKLPFRLATVLLQWSMKLKLIAELAKEGRGQFLGEVAVGCAVKVIRSDDAAQTFMTAGAE